MSATVALQQQSAATPLVVTFAAATSGGDTFQQDGTVAFRAKNGDSTPTTVTVHSHAQPGPGETTADLVVSVTNATTGEIGPFSAAAYTDPATGLVSVTYSKVTALSVAAVRNASPQA